jgi:hypothetical protein
MNYILIYKCRNCGMEKSVPTVTRMEGAHAALQHCTLGLNNRLFTTHRCSDVRVGLADLIAIEEQQ